MSHHIIFSGWPLVGWLAAMRKNFFSWGELHFVFYKLVG